MRWLYAPLQQEQYSEAEASQLYCNRSASVQAEIDGEKKRNDLLFRREGIIFSSRDKELSLSQAT